MAQRCQLRVRPFLGHVTVATISCWPDPMRLAMSFLGHPGNPNCPVSASTWPFDELELQRTAMDSKVRTVVTFESTAFNLAEPKNCFINPCCFGDDLAKWLIGELRKHGLETDDEPSQEDFGCTPTTARCCRHSSGIFPSIPSDLQPAPYAFLQYSAPASTRRSHLPYPSVPTPG